MAFPFSIALFDRVKVRRAQPSPPAPRPNRPSSHPKFTDLRFTVWGGQFENLERARLRLIVVVPACFAVIIALLYSAGGSWRVAAVVFTGLSLHSSAEFWTSVCEVYRSRLRLL